MANLFEKPIAAQPMSEFVGLPLDFISKKLEQKQSKYDAAKADIAAQEDSMLGLKFLPGDRERHMELQGQWDAKLDQIIENAGGDYSQIQAPLDRWKRDMSREISYGELGAQGSAYKAAQTMKEGLDKRALKGETSKGGMAMFNRSMQAHRTTENSVGGYNSFQGYTPSSVTDVRNYLRDEAKKINANYDPNGNKSISADRILLDMNATIASKGDLKNALYESYVESGGDPEDQEQLLAYENALKSSVISSVKYDEITKRTGMNGESGQTPRGTILKDIQMPRIQGSGTYEGGSLNDIKGFLDDRFGTENASKFNKWEKTVEGERMIRFLAEGTNEPYPSNYSDKVDWLDEHLDKPMIGNVVTKAPTGKDQAAVDQSGAPLYTGAAVYAEDGSKVDSRTAGIWGTNKDTKRTAKVIGTVDSGGTHAPGDYVIAGADGNTYIQENLSLDDNLSSPKYNIWTATKSKFTTSGVEENVVIRGIPAQGNSVAVPAGNYDSTYYPGRGNVLSQRTEKGVENKFVIFTDKNGMTTIKKL